MTALTPTCLMTTTTSTRVFPHPSSHLPPLPLPVPPPPQRPRNASTRWCLTSARVSEATTITYRPPLPLSYLLPPLQCIESGAVDVRVGVASFDLRRPVVVGPRIPRRREMGKAFQRNRRRTRLQRKTRIQIRTISRPGEYWGADFGVFWGGRFFWEFLFFSSFWGRRIFFLFFKLTN